MDNLTINKLMKSLELLTKNNLLKVIFLVLNQIFLLLQKKMG